MWRRPKHRRAAPHTHGGEGGGSRRLARTGLRFRPCAPRQRRGRDSNPGCGGCPHNGFQDRRIQPLCHPSGPSDDRTAVRRSTLGDPRRGGRAAEGTRLLSEYGAKSPSRVRIPPSPLAPEPCNRGAPAEAGESAFAAGREERGLSWSSGHARRRSRHRECCGSGVGSSNSVLQIWRVRSFSSRAPQVYPGAAVYASTSRITAGP